MRRSLLFSLFATGLLFLTQYAILRAAAPNSISTSMNQPIPADYTYHVMQPEGRAFLSCRVLLQENFKVADLPAETIDFEDPTKSLPLVVAVSPMGPMVFAVATRPAYGDGATSQWLEFLLTKDGFKYDEIRRTMVGIYPAVMCDALQDSDGMTMRSRMVLLEDGGRMLTMSAMAPDELWSAVEARFTTMINSFEFQHDKGATAALFPGEALPASATGLSTNDAATTSTTEDLPTARLTAAEFAAVVLADDATSFDQDSGINANLRDRGVGLVPRVLSIDANEKSARLGAGAIEAIVRVPFGWYALDDGRRTLVFDGENRIQINLSLRQLEGDSLAAYARALVEPYLEREPDLPVAELAFADGLFGAGVRGASIEGETLDQVFIVRQATRDGFVLVARVTATSEDSVRAMNLAGDIMARAEMASQMMAAR